MNRQERIERNERIKKYFAKRKEKGELYASAWVKTAKHFGLSERTIWEQIRKGGNK